MRQGQIQSVGPIATTKWKFPIVRLCLDRYPYLETAHAGSSVEFFVVMFEEGGVDSLITRLREPFCPDRHADAMDGRNVFAMGKYGVALGRNAQSCKFGREVGESGHLYAGEIVEVPIIVHVVTDAKRPSPSGAAPPEKLAQGRCRDGAGN